VRCIMTLPWPPNWRNKDNYPDPNTTSGRIWAWEYLRRNRGYQQLCDEIGSDWFEIIRNQVKQRAGLTDDEFKKIINPGKNEKFNFKSGIKLKLFDYLPAIEDSGRLASTYKKMCEEFKLLSPDHYKTNNSITVFKTDINCIRKTSNNQSIKSPFKLIRNNQNANRMRPQIFLSLLDDGYNNYSEICGDHKIVRDPLGNVHINYLRIYDAYNFYSKGKTESEGKEISRIIYGSDNKLSTVDKSYLSAIEYINGKYIALAAPIYKK